MDSSSFFLQVGLFVCLQCQVQLNTLRGKDFGFPPCCDMYSVIFCFLVCFSCDSSGRVLGVPVEWFGPVCREKMFLSVINFLLHLGLYLIKANVFFKRRTETGHIQCSGIELKPLCPSALLMGTCTTKQSLKLSSGNILRNSTFSHLLFPVCISSAPSPWQGLQITLGNQSQNLQHFLVPDANYSRTLKAIPQTQQTLRVRLCGLHMCYWRHGHRGTQPTASSDQGSWMVAVCTYHEESGVETLVSRGQAYMSLFPAFLKAISVLRWSESCFNYCQA